MISIENIFHRTDFDPEVQEITDITQDVRRRTRTHRGLHTDPLLRKQTPMSIWFVVADQLVRMQYGKPGGTKWPIKSLHMPPPTKTLTLSRDGHAAVAIMALDARHVAYLERFVRVLTQRGLDVT